MSKPSKRLMAIMDPDEAAGLQSIAKGTMVQSRKTSTPKSPAAAKLTNKKTTKMAAQQKKTGSKGAFAKIFKAGIK
ncbi:MAG: hypothetical protein NVS1B10_01530 [Candidatus Saccharimonadales bacterium]